VQLSTPVAGYAMATAKDAPASPTPPPRRYRSADRAATTPMNDLRQRWVRILGLGLLLGPANLAPILIDFPPHFILRAYSGPAVPFGVGPSRRGSPQTPPGLVDACRDAQVESAPEDQLGRANPTLQGAAESLRPGAASPGRRAQSGLLSAGDC